MKIAYYFFTILIFSFACKQKDQGKLETTQAKKDAISTEKIDSFRNPQHFAYLMDLDTKTTAELILSDSVKAGDNEFTVRLLDSLNDASKAANRTYYFKVVTKMMKDADGILSEALGVYAWEYGQKHSADFLDNFSKLSPIEKKRWVAAITGEINITHEGKEESAIANYINNLNLNCKKCTINNKNIIKEINKLMIEQLKYWENN